MTQTHAALVERLGLHKSWRDSQGELNNAPNEAGQAITDLEAEVARLRSAMADILPTTLCGESWGLPDSEGVNIYVTFGALRAARQALKGTANEAG